MEHPTYHQELASRSGADLASEGRRAPYKGESESSETESGGLVEYWRILRRNRGTLVIIAFLGLCASILFTLPQTPVYRARTAFEIQNVNTDFLNAKQVSPVSEDSAMNVLTDVQTQMKIIQSEALMDRVIDKLKAEGKLDSLQNKPGHLDFVWQWLHFTPVQSADADYAMRQKAINDLTVHQLGQTRVIEVLYNSTDPQFAALFLNTLANEYVESNMEARWKMSERTGEWLAGQLNEMRIKLERSEDALQEYARQSGLLFTTPSSGNSEKTNVSEDKLRQLQEELSKAMADRASSQSRYEIARGAPPDSVGDVLNDEGLRDLQAKLTDLHRRRAELITTFTAKHEQVQRIEAQIEPMQAEFNRERSLIIDHIRNEYDSSMRRQKILQADYDSQSSIVVDQTGKSIQYNILKRDVDSNRQLYESMLQQVKEASVASAIRASNIRLVDPAKTPRKAYSPNYRTNSVLGLLAGLIGGIAFVVIRQRSDRTLQEPGDTQLVTSLPELGVIPSSSLDKVTYYSRPFGPQRQPIGALNQGKSGAVELVSFERRPSMLAEAFRTVLTSVMFSGENGTYPHVLVLTSANPADGKTTIVCNLAIALAEIRKKVLIIDADLRRPRMHSIFDLNNEQGLSNLLTEPSLTMKRLESSVQQTSISGLSVLTSGPATGDAASLLYSPQLREMLNCFRADYDMVLIDTPPSLQMTDARVVGRLADAVILVVRAGQTTREAAVAVQQRFSGDRIRLLGTVLNDWNPRESPNGYYGYRKDTSYAHYDRGEGRPSPETRR